MRYPALLATALVLAPVILASPRDADAAEGRVPLAATVALAPEASLEASGSGRVPNYLRAIASSKPDAAPALAQLFRTTIYGGTLPPSVKLAMGLRVAEICDSKYAAAHLKRLLAATPPSGDAEATRLAVRYADLLTRDIHGVSDTDFAHVRGRFNDAQVVELTLTTCFFNYFARLCTGLGVEAEPWLSDTAPSVPPAAENPYRAARVTLMSDAEMQRAAELSASAQGQKSSWGIGIANSQRAMARVPDIGGAWFGYLRGISQGATVPRSTLLQVSLAVSTVNGCRYCTLHQVVGLRRQGVEISKLLALQKDDAALTPSERAAVVFARKLTATPGKVTDADFTALQSAFPGAQAMDVLLQTCTFAFMNRFTDGLHLPSEDEAIRIYRETYGRDYAERPKS